MAMAMESVQIGWKSFYALGLLQAGRELGGLHADRTKRRGKEGKVLEPQVLPAADHSSPNDHP